MKKIVILACALVLAFSVNASAETKIGIYNLQAVILKSEYGQAIGARLKAKFEPMEAQLKRDAEAIKKLESELKNQNLALKLEAKQDKQREYRRLTRDYQDSVVAYRQKRQVEQQKQLQPVVDRLGTIMEAFGKKNGFTVIFETASSGVSFIAPGVDITEQLIEELNKMKKSGK